MIGIEVFNELLQFTTFAVWLPFKYFIKMRNRRMSEYECLMVYSFSLIFACLFNSTK